MDQIKCLPKHQRKRKKQIRKLSSPRVENPSSRVDTIKHQMRKPKHQTKKKKEKKKKKTEKQTSHHQSLIWCKICEIPCYYQQIRYINNSNVRNTFGICGVKLRKRSVVGREALCYRDTMAWVGWPRSGEIVREEVRAVRASSWSTRMEMKLCFTEERSLRWETWREPLKRASKGAHHVNCFDCGTR